MTYSRALQFMVLAVLVVVFPGCGSSGGDAATTPTTPAGPAPQANRAPVIGSMTITAFGISELTPFNYTASATDADGDALTYAWDIAGNSRSGSNGSITFSGSGSAEVRLTVTDGKGGSASATRTITVGSMTGNWAFSVPGQGTLNMALSQNGTVVSGTFVVAPGGFGNVGAGATGRTEPGEPGRIDGDGNVQIRLEVGIFLDITLRGVMDSSGRRVTGSVTGSGFTGQPFTMTK